MTTDLTEERHNIPDSALKDIGLHEQITAIRRGASASQTDKPVGGLPAGDDFFAIDKLEAHLSNTRHVAVSIFIFDGKKLLIQRRAKSKYHSAGLWANTVCSHPRWNEAVEDCAQRRLYEELGWTVPLTPFGSIDYSAKVGALYENEHVHCYYGQFNQAHDVEGFNTLEVDAVEWVTLPDVLQRMQEQPEVFTEWFKIYMSAHRDMIEGLI